MLYKCPYCGVSSYASSSKNTGEFPNWSAVSRHVSSCSKNNKSYIISHIYGPILVNDFIKLTAKEIHCKYPGEKFKHKLRNTGYSKNLQYTSSKKDVVDSIKNYYKEYNKVPSYRDFNKAYQGVSNKTASKYFETWNKAIEAAGFEPNIQNGFGIDTYGLDGHLYRSQAEAYFADNLLYGKYTYDIEPKYPKLHNKYYDWYVKELDLYIELDGGIRPQVIAEKIKINKQLNRVCIVIPTKNLYCIKSINTLLNIS